MRMERKNSLRDSAVGSPDHYNLKNSKHSGCWSPFMDWLSWNMAEGLLFFFRNSYYLSFSEKEKKKSESSTSDTLSEEILYYNILLFWCFPTSKHWKLSSPSHFHQQESFIILSDNRKYGLPFLWKNNSPSNSDINSYPRGGINRHQEYLPLLETSTSWKQNTIGPQEGRMTNS